MRISSLCSVGLFLLLSLALSNASAQCPLDGWQPGHGDPDINATVRALLPWDPDGDGPQPPMVVAGGDFTGVGEGGAGYLAGWNGTYWRTFKTGFTDGNPTQVRCLALWDADGDGPTPPRLVAGGSFRFAGDTRVNHIAMLNGSSWEALGPGVFALSGAIVKTLTTWDPDGPGPLSPLLIAGGHIESVNGVPSRGIAAWNGAQWLPLGNNSFSTTNVIDIRSSVSFDPDGDGPSLPQLYVGGDFRLAGVDSGGIARWNGSNWVDVAGGVRSSNFTSTGAVNAMRAWDPDLDGPSPPRLAVGGLFRIVGTSTTQNIAEWDGSVWRPLSPNVSIVSSPIHAFSSLSTPTSERLVIGGRFPAIDGIPAGSVAAWDGNQWHPLSLSANLTVYALAPLASNPDALTEPDLIAGGIFTEASENLPDFMAKWDGERWNNIGDGLSDWIESLITWDPDDQGDLPPQVFAAGRFAYAGGMTVNGIAGWDGRSWHPLGSGMNNRVYSLTPWDSDGDGPARSQLIAAGSFSAAGGVVAPGVAIWDGLTWSRMGGLSATVTALHSWDRDGHGPLVAVPVAGGTTSSSRTVAAWNGTAWASLPGALSGTVYAITSWDPDGPGPALSNLIVGGTFSTAGMASASRVAMWDGSNWFAMGDGLSNIVYTLEVWDPDDDGPALPTLYAGGAFTMSGTRPVAHVARWDGQAWQPLGRGLTSTVRDLHVLPRGHPCAPSGLVACGSFVEPDTFAPINVALWSGEEWHSLRFAATPFSMTSWLAPTDAGPTLELCVGGSFELAPAHSSYFARLRFLDSTLTLCHTPSNATACITQSHTLTFDASSITPIQYEWQWRERSASTFITVVPGPNRSAGDVPPRFNVDGPSSAASLTLNHLASGPDIEFRIRVSTACEEQTAPVTTLTACAADFNCDLRTDSADLFAFLSDFFATASSSDINRDAVVNSSDFFEFLNALFHGCS